MEASSCLLIAVRGYNKVGLSSVSTGELHGCTVTSKHQLVVVDAVGELDVDNGQTRYSVIFFYGLAYSTL